MDAHGKDMARLNELTAWLTRTNEGGTAGFRLSTPDPAVARMGLAILGGTVVVVTLGLCAVRLLNQEPPRQQSADPALPDDDGSQQRLEPPA